jgi:hypothetical protein
VGIVLLCDAYGDAITDVAALDTSIQPFFDGAGHNTAFNISQAGRTLHRVFLISLMSVMFTPPCAHICLAPLT